MIGNKPELVCPAGDWPSLITAIENGADSVYFGIKEINMRHSAPNFDILEIKKIMDLLRRKDKKGYLALNVTVMNRELAKVEKILQAAKSARVDAVILWDMAVFSLAKELGLPIHLSTQASISNIKALEFFSGLGVRRIVLARECTLSDINEMVEYIKKGNIPCEIEAFIHGAMCVSISGRCFLSQYSFGKSANKGECLQPCRRQFFITDKEKEINYILGEDYILSPKDLCTIDFIGDLINTGIKAFKIEGRVRSPEYIKVVVSVYRKAIDSFFEGELSNSLKESLKEQLGTVYNRGFSNGFYFGQPQDAFSKQLEHNHEKVFLGEVKKFYKKISVAEILIRNESLIKGDSIIFIGKNTPVCFATAEELQKNHIFVDKAEKGEFIGLKLPFTVKPNDKVFLWRKKQDKG